MCRIPTVKWDRAASAFAIFAAPARRSSAHSTNSNPVVAPLARNQETNTHSTAGIFCDLAFFRGLGRYSHERPTDTEYQEFRLSRSIGSIR